MAESKIYHEKQSRELCALHALNNIFQAETYFQVGSFLLESLLTSPLPPVGGAERSLLLVVSGQLGQPAQVHARPGELRHQRDHSGPQHQADGPGLVRQEEGPEECEDQ